MSGLLHTDDDDWSDLGLNNKGRSESDSSDKRSASKSPIQTINEEERPENAQEESEDENRPLERWNSGNVGANANAANNEPVRRKSSEMSSTMKSRLEAFELQRQQEAQSRRSTEPEPDGMFKEKLKNFQKISSQSDLKQKELAKGPTKPPPKMSYSKLIDVSRISKRQMVKKC